MLERVGQAATGVAARGQPRLAPGEGRSATLRRAPHHQHQRRHQRAAARRIPWAGLSGGGGLHGPRQLGDLARRRLQVRLHAAGRRPHLQHHGHRSPGLVRAPGYRVGARSRPGLPRRLPALGRLSAVGGGRDRHHRHRYRRGDRHGHRPQPAVRHPARDRRGADRARRVPHPLPAAHGLSLSRGADHYAARRHRRLLRHPDRARQPGVGTADPRLCADHRDRAQSRHALPCHGHHRRHGDAAQPLPALGHRADPRLRAIPHRRSARR